MHGTSEKILEIVDNELRNKITLNQLERDQRWTFDQLGLLRQMSMQSLCLEKKEDTTSLYRLLEQY